MQPTLRLKIKAERCSKKVVKSVKKSISEKFALAEYSLTLVCIKEGCIELFFHISKATMSHMSTFVCVYDCIDVLARQGITCSCLQISNLNFNVPSRSSTMVRINSSSDDIGCYSVVVSLPCFCPYQRGTMWELKVFQTLRLTV